MDKRFIRINYSCSIACWEEVNVTKQRSHYISCNQKHIITILLDIIDVCSGSYFAPCLLRIVSSKEFGTNGT